MTRTQTITTAEQLFAAGSELGRCELIQGELRMMHAAGGWHGQVTAELAYRIGQFVREHDLGVTFAAETGFVLERDPDTVRAPDIAFIAKQRAAEARTEKFIPIPPDLAVETLSPSDTASEVAEKTQWWLDHGVKQVWIVDPKSRSITVHYPDATARTYRDGDTLRDDQLLPGLSIDLAPLFR